MTISLPLPVPQSSVLSKGAYWIAVVKTARVKVKTGFHLPMMKVKKSQTTVRKIAYLLLYSHIWLVIPPTFELLRYLPIRTS